MLSASFTGIDAGHPERILRQAAVGTSSGRRASSMALPRDTPRVSHGDTRIAVSGIRDAAIRRAGSQHDSYHSALPSPDLRLALLGSIQDDTSTEPIRGTRRTFLKAAYGLTPHDYRGLFCPNTLCPARPVAP